MATVQDYLFEESVLYHLDRGQALSRTNVSKQPVIPRSLKDEVMLSLHEEITSGHLSFLKTYLKIKQRFFWTGMYTEIEKWYASCVDGATKKTLQNLEGNIYRMAVDVKGPFPTLQCGNKYVVIFTYYFSKWPEKSQVNFLLGANEECNYIQTVYINSLRHLRVAHFHLLFLQGNSLTHTNPELVKS